MNTIDWYKWNGQDKRYSKHFKKVTLDDEQFKAAKSQLDRSVHAEEFNLYILKTNGETVKTYYTVFADVI